MRKVFLNAAALSLALLTVSPALQSCKDYDDDITNINGVTDDISKQILDLQKQVDNLSEAQKNALDAAANAANAAEAARKLAEDALKAGNQAEADALAAQAMASDAKAAAEQAKADMLASLTKEAQALRDLISANSKDIKSATEKIAQNATAIAELDGKISAVDAKLANYSTTADMVSAINKAISDNNVDIDNKIDEAAAEILKQVNALAARTTAIETQQATLEGYITALQTNYSELRTKVNGLSDEITTQQETIDNLNNELSGLKTNLDSLQSDLESLKSEHESLKSDLGSLKSSIESFEAKLETLDTKLTTLSSKVTTIESELNTLSSILLPGRLSSVTLVPNLYIGGIPTIEFMTISYNQWEADADKAGLYNVTDNKFEITSNDAIAHYRLNPSTVGKTDIKIDELSFVSSRAVSRADAEPALNVSKADITDGVLDVWVKNNNAGKLTDDAKSEITIAALKVPIANKHLFDNEKTTGAFVYSEYSRVAESYITPVIKAIPSSEIEGYDLTQYDLAQFANNDNIEGALEGNDFIAIDVVYNGDGQNLLDIVEGQYNDPAIVVNKDELNAWGLDFEFVLFGEELCPAAEYASIDGTTIKAIAPEDAKLSDAIGKTPWVAALLKDVANDQIIDVQYVQVKFVQDIRPVEETYAETIDLFCGEKEISVDWDWMNENILSKLNATNDMTPEEFIAIYTDTKITATAPNGDDVEADLVAVYDPEIEAYKWTISSADLDMSKLENQKFEGSIVCSDPKELYPVVTVKVEITVEISEDNMPVLNAGSIYWAQVPDGRLQYILAYPTDPRNADEDQVAEYNTNILQGRLAPYISNMLDCALWGTYFNDSKYYAEEGADPYVWFTTEYSDPNNFINGELPATKNALTGLSLNFWIDNTAEGIEMVQNEDKVLVDWKANLVGNSNSDDAPTFDQCWIYVKQPLYYEQIKELGITDNVGASVTCDLSGSWKVTDYYGNVVVNTEEYNYRSFYVLEDIEYKVSNAFLTRGESPLSEQIGTCADYKVSVDIENNTLIYTNKGAILLEDCYIQVPVELPHRWGTLKGTITVKLNKK